MAIITTALVVCLLIAIAAAAAAAAAAVSSSNWPPYTNVPLRPGYFKSLGNHRFNITISPQQAAAAGTANVTVVWRRSDDNPLNKAVYLRSAADNAPVQCAYAPPDASAGITAPSADQATFSFTPQNNSQTEYHLYYMPLVTCEYVGGACVYGAQSTYDPADAPGACTPIGKKGNKDHNTRVLGSNNDASAKQQQRQHQGPGAVAVYQARSEFESFEPMEMPMTAAERAQFVGAHIRHGASSRQSNNGVLVVADTNEFPVKMRRGMPARWATTASPSYPALAVDVPPGLNLTFQIAVVNTATAVDGPSVTVTAVVFSDLTRAATHASGRTAATGDDDDDHTSSWSAVHQQSGNTTIPASALRCMNLGGVDFWGRPVAYDAPPIPPQDGVLPLWVAAVIPPNITAGTYNGTATVFYTTSTSTISRSNHANPPPDSSAIVVQLSITVRDEAPVAHGGDDNMSLGSRLHWFDSRLGLGDEEELPAPYTPLVANLSGGELTVALLGKQVVIGTNGLPVSIAVVEPAAAVTTTTTTTTLVEPTRRAVLAGAVDFDVESLGAPSKVSLEVAAADARGMAVSWTSQWTFGSHEEDDDEVLLRHDGGGGGIGGGAATAAAAAAAAATTTAVTVRGSLDCTGYLLYNITVVAAGRTSPVAADDVGSGGGGGGGLPAAGVRLRVAAASAPFAMGLGRAGGLMDSWIGGTTAGGEFRLVLRSSVHLSARACVIPFDCANW